MVARHHHSFPMESPVNPSFPQAHALRRPLAWLMPSMVLSLAACASAGTAPASLVGSEWQLQSIDGQPVIVQSQASLLFPEAGRVAGNGSCNRFVGGVAIDKQNIVFRQIASTKMACFGGASEQETRYMQALSQAQRYEVVGSGELLIHVQGMGQPLRFTRTK
jgi:heat shock protein HslJ